MPPPDQTIDVQIDNVPHSSDTSIPLLALYLRGAEKADWRRFEILKGDLDQIIIFCGLFSAAIAALIVPLTPALHELLSPESNPTDQRTKKRSPQLSGAGYGACSLAFVALRWQYRYSDRHGQSRVTSPRHSLPKQARLHALHATGFNWFKCFHLVQVFHLLIHISLAFFLFGLAEYFSTFDLASESLVSSWFNIVYVVYFFLTAIPILKPGAPFSTPLSPIFAIVYAFIARVISRLYYWATWPIRICIRWVTEKNVCQKPKNYSRGWSMHKVAEDRAQERGARFDGDVLNRTLDMLRSDNDLEEFFDTIPGFYRSKIVHHSPPQGLDKLVQQRLAEALIGFWNRTLSSNLVLEDTKGRRLLVCMEVIEAAKLATAVPATLRGFSLTYLGGITRSVELGHSLGNLRHGNVAPLARGIIASIISNAERNDRWFTLAVDELDIASDLLRDYRTHGDSVLLANLIHITRHFSDGLPKHPDLTREALNILPSVSKFDIRDTLPELQHKFCALWNEVVVKTQQSSGAERNSFIEILRNIWGLCATLHHTTADDYDPLRPPVAGPASYPLCNDDTHRVQ